MNGSLRVRRIEIFPLKIPMRVRFEHAAASRSESDSVVVRIAAASPFAQHVGYGETLARPYVTGEDAESVVTDVWEILAPRLTEFAPDSFAEALDFIHALPTYVEGRLINAARAAVELALIDLVGRVFRRRAGDVAPWLELPGFGAPGALPNVRYSGMVAGRPGAKSDLLLRGQKWYGLRDFKIKVAIDGWPDRLHRTARILGRGLRSGRLTLRADANMAWSYEEAVQAVPLLSECGISALEQPFGTDDDRLMSGLSEAGVPDLIVDESLLTMEDAQQLATLPGVRVFNIRIAKNGGLMPALQMARVALQAGLDVQLGCLVGETSILSAAGVAFLQSVPRVRFVEGAFGSFLLREDVTRRPIRFGLGGRVRAPLGFGLGIDVDETAVRRLCPEPGPAVTL
jgi:muconate cycloisomerase